MSSILISAGESSGFLFADLLEREIKKLNPALQVVKFDASCGLGATLGFWEGMKKFWAIHHFVRGTFFSTYRLNPEVVVLIGFPGVNLFLGKKLREVGIPVVYLTPPQVWAWGSFRAKLLRQAANRVFCLFRFEEKLLRSLGVDAIYYGYPLLDSVVSSLSREEVLALLGLEPKTEYIVFLPGSRPSEIEFHQPLFLDIFLRLRRRYPELRGVVVGGTPDLAELEGVICIPRKQRYEVIRYARLALVASGTASAETAILGTPEVVCYHFNQPSRFFARVMVKLRYFSIPNIVANSPIIPEFFEPEEEKLYLTAQRLFRDGVYRQKVCEGLVRVRELLGPSGAMAKIASEILRLTADSRWLCRAEQA